MGKVVEITLSDISYKPTDSLNAIPHTIPKKEVFMIKYANGAKELFGAVSTAPEASIPSANAQVMYEKGRHDARKYYRGTGALVGSAFGCLASIFVPITIAAIPPKVNNIDIPDKSLLMNPDYRSGLKYQAHRKKVGKAATGVGITLAVGIAIIASVLSTY